MRARLVSADPESGLELSERIDKTPHCRPRAAMLSLVDALRDFEAGFRLDREQPRADQARPAIAARRPA